MILGDMRDPGTVLGSAEVRGLIDFDRAGRPAGQRRPALRLRRERPGRAARRLHRGARSRQLPGAVPHDQRAQAAQGGAGPAPGQRAGRGGAHLRSRAEVRRLFGGLPIVPPYPGAAADVTWVGLWNCEDPELADSEGSRWLYCGVARRRSYVRPGPRPLGSPPRTRALKLTMAIMERQRRTVVPGHVLYRSDDGQEAKTLRHVRGHVVAATDAPGGRRRFWAGPMVITSLCCSRSTLPQGRGCSMW